MALSRRLQTEERALEMRARRLPFAEIADELGITEAAAKSAVRRAQVKREIDKVQERRIEAFGLDLMYRDLVDMGNDMSLTPGERIQAKNSARLMSESKRKLLNLDEKDDQQDRGITFNVITALPHEATVIVDGESEPLQITGGDDATTTEEEAA